METARWGCILALSAVTILAGGCQSSAGERDADRAQECRLDMDRPPRDFLVTIHVGAPGTELLKEGSKVIAPGERPRFRVERSAGIPTGSVHIQFDPPQVSDKGARVTPFIDRGNAEVYSFKVKESSTGRPWTAPFRARSMCDRVCTFENQCKYSIRYVPDEAHHRYPVLDPFIIIH